MKLKSKHILGLRDMPVEDINYILDTAKTMKMVLKSPNKKTPHLQGKSIVTLFYENSTRTRVSFELAAKYMSASSANVSSSGSSVAKGETLIDTAVTINMMGADIVILRHPMAGSSHLLSKNINASVINAGDGMNEHPTQALLDMFTIIEKKGCVKGLKVAIIGDILHSRVARSNIWGLTRLGAEVNVAGPATLLPKELCKTGVKVFSTIHEAILDVDVIIALRIQTERQKSGLFPTIREYARFFSLDEKRLKFASNDVMIMHPGPVNRGIELSSSVIDTNQSFIDRQVENGVAIRMALLYLLTRREKNENTN